MKRFLMLGCFFLIIVTSQLSANAEDSNLIQMISKENFVKLEKMCNGDICVIEGLKSFSKEDYEYLRTVGILYPVEENDSFILHDQNESIDNSCIPDVDLIVYKKENIFHSNIIEKNSITKMSVYTNLRQYVDEFIDLVDNVILEKSSINRQGRSSSIVGSYTVGNSFSDTFTEAGVTRIGKVAYNTTYVVSKGADTSTQYDYYYVTGYNTITPYAGVAYVTNYFATGIAAYYGGHRIIDASPVSSGLTLEQNKNYSFSIGIGYPGSVSVGFSWTGKSGATLRGGIDNNHTYSAIFNDNTGLYGSGSGYSFTFNCGAFYIIPNNAKFAFQYNHHFRNAVYGNGSDPRYYGGGWYAVQVP